MTKLQVIILLFLGEGLVVAVGSVCTAVEYGSDWCSSQELVFRMKLDFESSKTQLVFPRFG